MGHRATEGTEQEYDCEQDYYGLVLVECATATRSAC